LDVVLNDARICHDAHLRIVGGVVTLGVGLIPIVPILLLPFILVFFVIVFPIWGLALGILGFLLVIIRGVDALAKRLGVNALDPARRGMERGFRWVLTFGGFAERKNSK
jgi:hypothetical protein